MIDHNDIEYDNNGIEIDYSDIEFIEFDLEIETEDKQPINTMWHLIANEV